jgi:hypothetical protein
MCLILCANLQTKTDFPLMVGPETKETGYAYTTPPPPPPTETGYDYTPPPPTKETGYDYTPPPPRGPELSSLQHQTETEESYFIHSTGDPFVFKVPSERLPDYFMPWVDPFTSVISGSTGRGQSVFVRRFVHNIRHMMTPIPDRINIVSSGKSSLLIPLGRILRNFGLCIHTPLPSLRVTFGHYVS